MLGSRRGHRAKLLNKPDPRLASSVTMRNRPQMTRKALLRVEAEGCPKTCMIMRMCHVECKTKSLQPSSEASKSTYTFFENGQMDIYDIGAHSWATNK